MTIWLHCNIVLPPLSSSTFQKVGREYNSVIGGNMCSIKLTLDGTEPIISFKGLRRTTEYRWLEEDEVLNAHNHIALTSGILLNELQKACLITSILLSFHQDFRRRRRWWRFMSGPGVSVCKPRYNTIIWRAENRPHLSKQTRPSTERSRGASHVRGIPSRPDDQL